MDSTSSPPPRAAPALTWQDISAERMPGDRDRIDLIAVYRDRVVGRVMEARMAWTQVVFSWSLTGPRVPPELRPAQGAENTCEAAQAALSRAWARWVAWRWENPTGPAWHSDRTYVDRTRRWPGASEHIKGLYAGD